MENSHAMKISKTRKVERILYSKHLCRHHLGSDSKHLRAVLKVIIILDLSTENSTVLMRCIWRIMYGPVPDVELKYWSLCAFTLSLFGAMDSWEKDNVFFLFNDHIIRNSNSEPY